MYVLCVIVKLNKMLDFIFVFIGWILLSYAISIGRKEDSKIKTFSKRWWIQVFLLINGVYLLKYFDFSIIELFK